MKFYDLIIITPDDELRATRSLLAYHSAVLKDQLYSTEANEISEIRISDFPSSVTRKVLEILYSGQHTITFDDITEAVHLFHFCRSYLITTLDEVVKEFLTRNVNYSNVCKVHDLACELNLTYVQFLCWRIFNNNWWNIFCSEDFIRCKETTIFKFLSRPSFIPEVDLLLALFRWVKRNYPLQNTRNAIERFIPYIQFRRISKSQLQRHVFPLGILQYHEKMTLINDNYVEPLPLPFSSLYDRDTFDIKKYILPIYYQLTRKKIKFLRERDEFLVQFKISLDGFLTSVRLPLEVLSEAEVQFDVSVKINETVVTFFKYKINIFKDGPYLVFKDPLFMDKSSDVNVRIIIQRVVNSNIIISPNLPYYVCPLDYTDFRNSNDWRKFNVHSFWVYF